MIRLMLALPLGLAAALAALPAAAQDVDSTYTDLDINECTLLSTDELGAQWACPGYKGYPLYVAEGDLRFFVSYGFGALEQRAATQGLGPFNTLGPRIEWRMSNATGDWKPFATILRYFTEPDPDYRGEVLVVTTLGPAGVCHIAYIDARANPDPNAMAREVADSLARTFDCATEPLVWGVRDRSF
ncbi:MAG: hypothetical protein WEB63_11050 [Cucumibacter sp.]